MTCPSCGKDNPSGMRFCVHCGAQLATAAAQRTETPPSVTPSTPPFSGTLPAYRPFGIVFIVVWTVSWALTWIILSVYASVVSPIMMMRGLVKPESNELLAQSYGLLALSMLCIFLGLLSMTGAIGLWLLTRWGRNLVALLQGVNILLCIVMMSLSSSHEVQQAGLSGLLIIPGLFYLAFSVIIMGYLLRPQMDIWFRER